MKQKPNFFLVTKDSSDDSLHAHIIIRYHPEDRSALNKMLRPEASDHDNAVMIQDTYKLWLDAEPASPAWQLNKLAYETKPEYCTYPELGIDRYGRERFFRILNVNAGAADYISKELETPLGGSSGGSRLYIEAGIKSRGRQLYLERYQVMKTDTAKQVVLI